ncbi:MULTISPECIES: class F sortase [Micrococcaceae]|uniref:class F sortase n=1 Tax=Micrococcaceae TaxID=1268 RepID=UPI00161097AE|nr:MULTISPECIES: class F sortase [Micrococcaceae]MBB5749955.1 sortase (surface protein transpeptidase) [Micrococcus sp. TA1]HRO31035.1 class F sortase [Citricoccus sp.]HRO93189.1 class F sortase [Citricoccus sp.]
MSPRDVSTVDTRRPPVRPRRLSTVLAGTALAVSLAGCSMDTSAFLNNVESAWKGPADTLATPVAPAGLEIPAIGLRTGLIGVQVQDDGTLGVPDSGEDVGWYSPDEDPAGGHPTVFVAHVDTPAGPAVFGRLPELRPGHEVRVTDAGGDARVYRVDRVEDHPVDDFPTLEVYGAVAGDEIRLITCTGVFDTGRDQYLENRVVYASRSG